MTKLPTIPTVQCLNPKCGYEWIRIVQSPRVCPRCKSHFWNDKAHWLPKEPKASHVAGEAEGASVAT